MNRKPLALALGFILPFLGALAATIGLVSSESLYPTVLALTTPTVKTDREGASPVVLVEIDNASQDAQGPWPWPASRVDDLILSIANSGARSVVVDKSMFSDPDHGPTPALWSALPGGVPVVVPASAPSGTFSDACQIWKLSATDAEASFPEVGTLALPSGVPCDDRFSAGLDTLVPSEGGLSYPLLWSDGRHLIPSLPLAALLVSSPNVSVASWWASSSRTIAGPHGKTVVDAGGSILMRPLGAPGQGVPRVNAATVLAQKGSSNLFRDRVVVVGVTASGLVPTCAVPFTAPLAGDRMPRAEATATVLLDLLDQSTVLQPAWSVAVFWVSLAVTFLLAWLGLARFKRRWTVLALLALLAAECAGWWIVFQLGLWVSPLAFLVPALGAWVTVLAWPGSSARSARPVSPAPLPPRPQRVPENVRNAQSGSSSTMEVAVASGVTESQMQRGPDGELTRLGRYVDLSPIGSGGMCKVYAAHDPVMDRKVAIKILRTDKAKGHTTEQRFLREARIAGSLQHPHINTVYDFGQADDLLYLVLEFVEGETLGQWIKEHNGVRPKAIVPWIHQIGDALDAAHAANIVHRDVKPSNLMIVRSNGGIKLMDFGVARTPDVTLTQAGTTVGTPNYMSPEQLQGSKVGPSSDLYAFGVVVYQLLSQRLPFHGEGLTALCNAILKGQGQKLSTHRPDLAGPVEQAVHRAFSVKSEDRFPTGGEFADAFEKAAAG
jgi:CHASE2 domain-containing sensor protein/tRNA A-37 threonylcarbamoyl transferase component Bud32